MENEKLRVKLTKKERKNWWSDVAVVFIVDPDKNLTVQAEWAGMDELYGDGCAITIPARVWAIASPWIAERTI